MPGVSADDSVLLFRIENKSKNNICCVQNYMQCKFKFKYLFVFFGPRPTAHGLRPTIHLHNIQVIENKELSFTGTLVFCLYCSLFVMCYSVVVLLLIGILFLAIGGLSKQRANSCTDIVLFSKRLWTSSFVNYNDKKGT